MHRSHLFMVNPALAGTKKTIDVRTSYRQQWLGFEGAPQTSTFSLHSRFLNGTMGAGGFIYNDKLGPLTYTAAALALAYHLRFADTELSFGFNGSYNALSLNSSKITLHNSQDPLATNSVAYGQSSTANTAAGILFYNDRFYLGASANNLLGSSFKFRGSGEKSNARLKTVAHYSLNVGYNWSADPKVIFENSVLAHLVVGSPILFDYNLRIHYRHSFFIGAGIRLKNAIIAQTGFSINQGFQIAYAYDFGINSFTAYKNTGSHEIKLVFVYDKDQHKRHGNSNQFARQKYQNLL